MSGGMGGAGGPIIISVATLFYVAVMLELHQVHPQILVDIEVKPVPSKDHC